MLVELENQELKRRMLLQIYLSFQYVFLKTFRLGNHPLAWLSGRDDFVAKVFQSLSAVNLNQACTYHEYFKTSSKEH